jgi:hypothetical protein
MDQQHVQRHRQSRLEPNTQTAWITSSRARRAADGRRRNHRRGRRRDEERQSRRLAPMPIAAHGLGRIPRPDRMRRVFGRGRPPALATPAVSRDEHRQLAAEPPGDRALTGRLRGRAPRVPFPLRRQMDQGTTFPSPSATVTRAGIRGENPPDTRTYSAGLAAVPGARRRGSPPPDEPGAWPRNLPTKRTYSAGLCGGIGRETALKRGRQTVGQRRGRVKAVGVCIGKPGGRDCASGAGGARSAWISRSFRSEHPSAVAERCSSEAIGSVGGSTLTDQRRAAKGRPSLAHCSPPPRHEQVTPRPDSPSALPLPGGVSA